MGTKNISHTHRLIMCGLKKLAWIRGFAWKVENNGGGGGGGRNGTKTSSPVTRGDSIRIFPHPAVAMNIKIQNKIKSIAINSVFSFKSSLKLMFSMHDVVMLKILVFMAIFYSDFDGMVIKEVAFKTDKL